MSLWLVDRFPFITVQIPYISSQLEVVSFPLITQGRIQGSEKGGHNFVTVHEHGNCVQSAQFDMPMHAKSRGSGGMPPRKF